MEKYKFSIVKNNNVDKATLIDDLKHFINAFEHSKNTSFEYATDTAIFKVEVSNENKDKTQFVDGACHVLD